MLLQRIPAGPQVLLPVTQFAPDAGRALTPASVLPGWYQARLVVNGEVAAFIETFAEPQTVADFHRRVMALLQDIGVAVTINELPALVRRLCSA